MMDYYQMAAHTYGVTGSNGLVGRTLAEAAYSKKSKRGKNASAAVAAERKEMGKAMNEILPIALQYGGAEQSGVEAAA